MSNYPANLDTDADIPRVEDNITEIGSDTLNALREAIFAVQAALGENPQGSTQNVVTRLNAIQNPDGTFKSSAITAAGLIALPIVNSQVGASAAIEESKLDLDVATQLLQDQITSNDIDIDNLRTTANILLNDYAAHVAGTADNHDGFDIYLDKTSPSSPPAAFVSLTSTDVSNAIIEINNRFITHAAAGTVGAHRASNISVVNNFTAISATDAQTALEELDQLRSQELITHRDEMHSNGFSNWSNFADGYTANNQVLPAELGETIQGFIANTTERKRIRIDGYTLASFNVQQGDSLVLSSPTDLVGQYIVDDVGPRDPIGTKALLLNSELEITSAFPYVNSELLSDGLTTFDGYVDLAVYAQSSQDTLQGNCAATIHQSGTTVDSVQVARPNAARAHSLGLDTKLIDGTETLVLEAGVGNGTRSITINNLNRDRNGSVVSEVTAATIAERINSEFQNAADGYAFPAAAYSVGDELVVSHNWQDSIDYTLRVTSTGTGNFVLGFDGYGADIVNRTLRPTLTTYFYVNGRRHTDFATIASGTATASGTQTIIVTGFNPLQAGVKVGHLLHVKSHSTVSENGTYLITGRTSNTITVHKTAGIASGSFSIEILHDAVPLNEFRNSAIGQIIEIYIDQNAQLNHNNRLEYSLVANLEITNISDNFVDGDYQLDSTVNPTADYVTFQMGSFAESKSFPRDFEGRTIVYGPSNIDFIEIDVTNPVGAGTSAITVNEHINEEEFLEVCTVLFDGTEIVSDVRDKRLFGSVGLDEIREDYTQARVELPQSELRSNGVVYGFDIMDGYYTDTSYPGQTGVLIRGGASYVGGVRCDIPTTPVMLPNTAGVFYIALNDVGSFKTFTDNSPYNLSELLDGYAGDLAFIAKVEHDGTSIIEANNEDLRYFINNLDAKLDIIVDTTNNRIGNFGTFEAAQNYVNNYPQDEKFKIKIVSRTLDDIVVNSNRDITLEIEGKIGSLTLNSSCRVTSSSLVNRADPHIDGYLTINTGCSSLIADSVQLKDVDMNLLAGGEYIFNGCSFVGTATSASYFVTSGAPAIKNLTFTSCSFASTYGGVQISPLTTIDGIVRFIGCYFDGGATSGLMTKASAHNIIIDSCKFDNWGFAQNDGTMTVISNSIFENMTTNVTNEGTLDLVAPIYTDDVSAKITNCLFDTILTDATGQPIIKTAFTGSFASNITDCIFDSCNVSAGGEIITMQGTVKGCRFNSVTYSSTWSFFTTIFDGNEKIVGTGDAVVEAEIFVNNRDFDTLQTSSLISVHNNVFSSPANTSLSNISLTGSANDVSITGNAFNAAANVTAISFVTNVNNVVISGNHFDGAGATSLGIDLADSGGASNLTSVVISNNIFKEIVAIDTSTDDLNELTITGNQMVDQPISLRIGSDFIFTDNQCADVTFTSGGTITRSIISDNIYEDSTLTVSNNLDEATVTGNVGGTSFSAALTNVVFAGNRGPLTVGAAATITTSLFEGNVITAFTNTTGTWTSSMLSDNYFEAGTDIDLELGGQLAFENNIVNSNINLSGTLERISCSNNICLVAAKTITTLAGVNNSFISRNIRLAIDISLGANSSIVSLNNLQGQDITISGTVESTAFDSNYCTNIDANCSSSIGFSIKNNRVFNNINIFGSAGSYAISRMAAINNIINGNINIGAGVAGGNAQVFTNSLINNNNMSGDIFLYNSGNTTASIDISGNIISNNAAGEIRILGVTGNFDQGLLIVSDLNIFGNTITTLSFGGGARGSATLDGPTLQDITVSNNNISTVTINDLVIINGVTFQNNILGIVDFNLYPYTAGDTYNSLSLIGNQINTSITFDIDRDLNLYNTLISTNLMPDVDTIIDLDPGIANPIEIQNFVVTNNVLRALAGIYSAGGIIDTDFLKVTGNLFEGQSAANKGTTYEKGVYFELDNASATLFCRSTNITANSLGRRDGALVEVRFREENGRMLLQNSVISNNTIGFIDFSVDPGAGHTGGSYMQVFDTIISNNYLSGGIRIEDLPTLAHTIIEGNYCEGTGLLIDINSGLEGGAVGAAGLIIANNFVQTILALPENAEWNAGAVTTSSKIVNNHATTWQGYGAGFTLSGLASEKKWCWGNTGTNTVGTITMTGTTIRDVTTTNDLSGDTLQN